MSGSATAAEAIVSALQHRDLEVSTPPHRRHFSYPRLLFEDFVRTPLRGRCFDMVIATCNTGVSLPSVPLVLVIHDVMPLDLPELFDRKFRTILKAALHLSITRATRVVVPSHYTAARLRVHYPRIAPIDVVPWPCRGAVAQARAGFDRAKPTVLVVGETALHKRHTLAVSLVAALRAASGLDVRLLIIGPPGNGEIALQAALREADPASKWATRSPRVSDSGLDTAYRDSWILLQPSTAEGYGLPVLEACQRGLPTLHSGAGALSEISPTGTVQEDTLGTYLTRSLELLDHDSYVTGSRQAVEEASTLTEAAFADALISSLELATHTPDRS